MEKKKMGRRAHCLVLSYPTQGHINPLLQFSKLLERQGIRITFVTTRSFCSNLQTLPPSIALETISDGFDKGGPREAGDYKLYIKRFWEVGPPTFAELLKKLGRSKDEHVDCVVYDSFFSWALDVAKGFGIAAAAYLTQNMAVNSIFYHVHLGNLQSPLTQDQISLPALPKLHLQDMSSFFFDQDLCLLDFMVSQFPSIHKADWIQGFKTPIKE